MGEGIGISRAEIIGALASATVMTIGLSPDAPFSNTLLSLALGRRVGLTPEQSAALYWYSLLRYAGCHAENHAFSAIVGDEIAFNRGYAAIDTANPRELIPLLAGLIARNHAGEGTLKAWMAVLAGIATGQRDAEAMIAGHCEVAEHLARRLGFEGRVIDALGQFRERWDGKGLPFHVAGEDILIEVRIAALCHDAALLDGLIGREEMLATVRKRRGTAYDPGLVDAFLATADALLAEIAVDDPRAAVLALESGGISALTGGEIDSACMVIADFCDLQLPSGIRHSTAVATLADHAAGQLRLPGAQRTDLYRAALLHDIGYSALPVRARGGHGDTRGIAGDVKLHPFHGEEIVGRIAGLSAVAGILGRHHEAPDGSGYFRGLSGVALSLPSRILAAAELYQSVREGRFGAPPKDEAGAVQVIRFAVTAGTIDPDAGKAILAAAGHKVPVKHMGQVAGLTGRELDTLRLAVTGMSMKEMGKRLGISPKTVDNHLQSIYGKIGVRTRAGATLFAIEHGLCELPK